MSEPLVTQRELEGLLRRLRALELRIGRTEVRERLLTVPVTPYTPDYFGATTAGVTTFTTRVAAYVRIGPLVVCYGRMIWTAATGTGVAQARILPIACNSTTGLRATGAFFIDLFTFAGSWAEFLIPEGGTDATLYTTTTNAAITGLVVEAAADIAWDLAFFL
jgi:hypothetical protein